ncbi:hypothetical protein HWN40_08365 [Methanolobus zinderi]|uniref:Uncharacterized protein n=1 Tax=Methanolobus zinderi TaxID=536044 RepID=A0A7D5E6Y6_9EURY|nr:hypothetical protein HWN40_08365 [Methanolobus zinderi]
MSGTDPARYAIYLYYDNELAPILFIYVFGYLKRSTHHLIGLVDSS